MKLPNEDKQIENVKEFTIGELRALKPCPEGFAWYCKNVTSTDLKIILPQIAEHNWSWCRWLFVRLLDESQGWNIAIYCAELVLPIFEEKYPDDMRPREAIQATKDYSDDKISAEELREKRDAAYAAYAAYYAADTAAAYAAAAAAAAAAYAAAAAAAAYYAADYVVAHAANAADAAYAASAVGVDIKMRIVSKVLELLEEV